MRFEQINLNQAGAGGGPEKGPEKKEPQEESQDIEKAQKKQIETEEKQPLQEKEENEKNFTQAKEEKKLTETEKKDKKEWLAHLNEELQKIKDLEKNTELQRIKAHKEAMKLLNDWLPFGNLDNFKGIEELMEVMEEHRPKTMITFNYRKEKLAKRVAIEMALQWDKTEKSENEKTERIVEFVDKWLKEKSFYYKMAEEFKNYLLKPPEKYLQQRAKYGYFAAEKIEEPSKVDIWFAREKSTLLKLLGERDRTLAEVSKILALYEVPYKPKRLQKITKAIENQNIKNNTLVKVREIEEMTDKQKKARLEQVKDKYQTLPILPLKIEMYEKLYKKKSIEKEIEKLEGKVSKEDLLNTVLAGKEIVEELKKSPEGKVLLEKLQNKVKDIVNKEKQEAKPGVISKAKEFFGKNKKEGWWSAVGVFAGYSLLLLLVLFVMGEIKLGEAITKGSFDFKSK